MILARYLIVCPACAVTVDSTNDRAVADDICKAAEHGDVPLDQEPYIFDNFGVGEPS